MSSDAVQEAAFAVDRYNRYLEDPTTKELFAGLKMAAIHNMRKCLDSGLDPNVKLQLEAEARVYLSIVEKPTNLLIAAWQHLYGEEYLDQQTQLLNPAGVVETE